MQKTLSMLLFLISSFALQAMDQQEPKDQEEPTCGKRVTQRIKKFFGDPCQQKRYTGKFTDPCCLSDERLFKHINQALAQGNTITQDEEDHRRAKTIMVCNAIKKIGGLYLTCAGMHKVTTGSIVTETIGLSPEAGVVIFLAGGLAAAGHEMHERYNYFEKKEHELRENS